MVDMLIGAASAAPSCWPSASSRSWGTPRRTSRRMKRAISTHSRPSPDAENQAGWVRGGGGGDDRGRSLHSATVQTCCHGWRSWGRGCLSKLVDRAPRSAQVRRTCAATVPPRSSVIRRTKSSVVPRDALTMTISAPAGNESTKERACDRRSEAERADTTRRAEERATETLYLRTKVKTGRRSIMDLTGRRHARNP
jgi:hypothetical protein